MDSNVFMQAEQWIQQEFADRQTASRDQLASDAQGSNLPQEAKQAIQQMPQGQYTKDDLIAKVREQLMSSAGGMMGGMGGGMGGGTGGGMGGGGYK